MTQVIKWFKRISLMNAFLPITFLLSVVLIFPMMFGFFVWGFSLLPLPIPQNVPVTLPENISALTYAVGLSTSAASNTSITFSGLVLWAFLILLWARYFFFSQLGRFFVLSDLLKTLETQGKTLQQRQEEE